MWPASRDKFVCPPGMRPFRKIMEPRNFRKSSMCILRRTQLVEFTRKLHESCIPNGRTSRWRRLWPSLPSFVIAVVSALCMKNAFLAKSEKSLVFGQYSGECELFGCVDFLDHVAAPFIKTQLWPRIWTRPRRGRTAIMIMQHGAKECGVCEEGGREANR